MMYLALLVALSENGETFTISVGTKTRDKKSVYSMLKAVAQVSDDEMDTILIITNAGQDGEPPYVVEFWRAANGDFQGL